MAGQGAKAQADRAAHDADIDDRFLLDRFENPHVDQRCGDRADGAHQVLPVAAEAHTDHLCGLARADASPWPTLNQQFHDAFANMFCKGIVENVLGHAGLGSATLRGGANAGTRKDTAMWRIISALRRQARKIAGGVKDIDRLWGPCRAGLGKTRRGEESRMKIVYRAENIIDAHLVKGALAQEGIVAFVNGEYLTGAVGELPVWNLVSVMVADQDVERATTVAQSIDADLCQRRSDFDDAEDELLPAT